MKGHRYIQRAASNSSFLGLLIEGGGENSAGLPNLLLEMCNLTKKYITHIEVPQFAAGLPIMMLSDTPAILSFFPNAEASNK